MICLFYGHRKAVQDSPSLSRRASFIGTIGSIHGSINFEIDDRVNISNKFSNTIEIKFEQLSRRQLTSIHKLKQLGCGSISEIGHVGRAFYHMG